MHYDPVITYEFELPDGTFWCQRVQLNRVQKDDTSESRPTTADLPEWTRLNFQRCDNCPLIGAHSHCPAAVDSAPLLQKFAHVSSISRMKVTVYSENRTTITETDAQSALKALLGLVMATSSCPILAQLRSQAIFHLPFASVEETLYRTVGDYLLKQYFKWEDGEKPDFALQGLDALYRNLATINKCFFKRVQAASTKDANLNALVVLHNMSDIVTTSLEDRLSPLREVIKDLI